MSTQSLVGLPKYRLSQLYDMLQARSYSHLLNPMTDHLQTHSAEHAQHPDSIADLKASVYMTALWYSYTSSLMTDSVKSHSIGWTYCSSPLAACTHSHASSVRLRPCHHPTHYSIGHPVYVPGHIAPTTHLWSDMHDTSRITSPEESSYCLSKMQLPCLSI